MTQQEASRTTREARIHIPHEEFGVFGFGEFVSLARDAGLRNITELVCQSDGCLVALTVDGLMDEAMLSDLDCLEWWERLASQPDEKVYLCKIEFPNGDEESQPLYNPEISNDDIEVTDDGVDVELIGPQADIAKELDVYREAGMNVLLRRITDYDGPSETLDSLTDRQREILEMAYDLGYFDVPRSASSAAVAEELGLDDSTVAEHLQRAERNLVASLLDAPQ